MKYVKFEVGNFKGIEDLELDLDRHPNSKIFTLVGLNESGKTTVLEAINFFKNPADHKDNYKFIPKSKKSNFNGEISVLATVKLAEEEVQKIKEHARTELNFEIDTLPTKIKISRIIYFASSKHTETKDTWECGITGFRLNEETNENGDVKKVRSELIKLSDGDAEWLDLIKYIEGQTPQIIYYPNFLFGFPPKIYLQSNPNENKEQVFYRAIIQDILDSLKDGLTIQEHILERISSGTEESKDALEALLDKMGSVVSTTILAAWETMFDKQMRKDIVFKLGKDSKGDYLEVKLKEESLTYNIDERSLGFKWFFTFLLFTEFRKNRIDDPGETIFLLDEPASNLHSTAQLKLLKTLERLTDNCSLVYTTHSHHLINPKWLPATFIIKNESLDYKNEEEYNPSSTNIKAIPYRRFVGNHPTEKDYFQPILDKIEYQPSLLEQVPDVIVTEGKYDYYTFNYINHVILGGRYDLRFYPGAGVNKLADIFRLYLAWGRPVLAIFDSDRPGKSAKKRYVRDVSAELSSSIYVLSEINSAWEDYTTESLFFDEDKKAILKKVFGSEAYSKNKFNNALQELFISTDAVELTIPTLKNFEQLFDGIESKKKGY